VDLRPLGQGLDRGAFTDAIANTMVLATGCACSPSWSSRLVAYYIVRSKYPGRGLLDFLSWLPFAIPASCSGSAPDGVPRAQIFHRSYGTILMIFAQVVASLTLGTQIVRTNMMQLSAEWRRPRASRRQLGHTLRRIVLPIIVPVLLLVAVLNFIFAVRDVSTVALRDQGTRTLSLLQLDYMMDGNYRSAAVLSILVVVLTTGVALLARALGLRIGVRAAGAALRRPAAMGWPAPVVFIGCASVSRSCFAQISAAPATGFSTPGSVTQPPFSMNSLRLQLSVALSATSFAPTSAPFANLSTQSAATTLARPSAAAFIAISRAEAPVTQPPQVKPTTMVATAQAAQAQKILGLGRAVFPGVWSALWVDHGAFLPGL
jgi:ABC-type spermidine/putrescine transport system permease subunit II